MTVNGIGEPLPVREHGEVFITWTEEGPRIAAAARSVLITVPLLALVEAGDSPWASLSEAGLPSECDALGWRGAMLRIEADDRTLAYRIGEYLPAQRCYVAELEGEPSAITG